MAHATRAAEFHRTGEMPEPIRRWYLDRAAHTLNARLRSSRLQFIVETHAYMRDHETALTALQASVDAGLYDILWIDRCPVLAPMRELARFRELGEIVRQRARAIIDAVRSA